MRGVAAYAYVVLPLAPCQGSDDSFLDKLMRAHRDNPRLAAAPAPRSASALQPSAAGFTIAHFAGRVAYSAHGFLLKNKDPLSEDLQAV